MEAVYLLLGFVLGGIAIWLVQHYRFASKRLVPPSEVDDLKSAKTALETERHILQQENENLKSQLSSKQEEIIGLNQELSREKAERRSVQEKLDDHSKELESIQQRFQKEFENLANKIFDDKSEKFKKQNVETLDQIIKPLNKDITEFKKKVEETYVSESKDRVALKEQIGVLAKLNQQMSEDATNLTKALKGDSKTQGTWGEFRLETVLESVGLERGKEYLYQESYKDEDGKRLQPDVVVNLPGNKHFVIDAKVSLTAYEKYCSAINEDEQKKALREHLESINSHILSLNAKDYQSLYQIASPDYVFMFIPVEPAFNLALQNSPNLFNSSFDKGIVLVTPSTLLVTLRTVEYIWRQEKHNRNAEEIAQRSGDLYDKFVGFAEQLQKIGNNIRKTQESYDDAMNKLKDGKGNLIRRAELIRSLGAKTKKTMPRELTDEVDEPLLLTEMGEVISDEDEVLSDSPDHDM